MGGWEEGWAAAVVNSGHFCSQDWGLGKQVFQKSEVEGICRSKFSFSDYHEKRFPGLLSCLLT